MSKFDGVHPDLVARMQRVLQAMSVLGFPMLVTDGVRTTAQQQALYAKGRTAPGPIVTNADGVVKRSNHQVHEDGLGHAVDCAFVLPHGGVSWDGPWALYGAAVQSQALTWGGTFHTIVDRPHAEL